MGCVAGLHGRRWTAFRQDTEQIGEKNRSATSGAGHLRAILPFAGISLLLLGLDRATIHVRETKKTASADMPNEKFGG